VAGAGADARDGSVITTTNDFVGDPDFWSAGSAFYHLGAGSAAVDILQESGQVDGDQPPSGYCPLPSATQANQVQQLDLWPRVLGGGTYFSIVHLIDVATWYVWGHVLTDKRTDTLMRFLVATWQRSGVPQYLQVDNEMSFTGGRWFSRLGRFVRLGLLLGSEVWFNPFQHSGMQCLRGALPWPV
jgi:hypothetical protein